MKRLMALAVVICMALPMMGCFHNQIITQKDYNAAATAPDSEEGFNMYLLFSLIPLGAEKDLSQVCPQTGAGLVEVEQTFVNGLLNTIIGGILSFQTTRVYCATGKGGAAAAPAEEAPATEPEPAASAEAPEPAEGEAPAGEEAEGAAEEGAEAPAE